MKGWTRWASLALAALTALVGMGSTTGVQAKQTTPYQFTVVADSTRNRFDPASVGCAAINDLSQIAFRVRLLNGQQVVYRTSRTGLQLITPNPRLFTFIRPNPSINNRGEVAFNADLRDGTGIFRGAGGALTTIARTEPGPFNVFSDDVSLNTSGDVAFRAELDDDFDVGLFVGNGTRTRTIFLASTTPFDGTFIGPALNERNQIAFIEYPDAGGEAVFRTDGQTFTPIADDTGPISSFEEVTLNDRGVVVVEAFLDGGGAGAFAGTGGALQTVVNTETSPFASLGFGGVALNNSNTVAFAASLDAGGQGLFVGPDPIADRVIGTGDALGSSTVADIVFCREGLNNNGNLAFVAQLADDRTVVVLATR